MLTLMTYDAMIVYGKSTVLCALVTWLEQVLLALISTDKVNLLVYTLGETF